MARKQCQSRGVAASLTLGETGRTPRMEVRGDKRLQMTTGAATGGGEVVHAIVIGVERRSGQRRLAGARSELDGWQTPAAASPPTLALARWQHGLAPAAT